MKKKIKDLLLNFKYNISEISDIEYHILKISNLKVENRLKVCLDLIKKFPNIPHYYLCMADALHLICDEEKFYYYDLFGQIRNQWLKDTKLDIFNVDFVSNIYFTGSLGNHYGVESLINSHRSKLKNETQIISLIGSKTPRNITLLNFFKKYVNFIEEDYLCKHLQSFENLLSLPLGTCLPMNNSSPFLDLASNITQTQLKKLNLSSNLFNEDDEIFEDGYKKLAKIGINRNDYLVTLHMREPTYRGETYSKNNSGWRNVDIGSYLDSIKELTSKGAYVFRMGDKNSTKLPKINGLIDYAHTDLKSDYMDVFLGAKSKFCIATSSGFYHIPLLFGKPIVFTNSPMFIEYFGLRENDIYLPRLTKNKNDIKPFKFSKFTNKNESIRTFQNHFDKHEIVTIHNTPEEILNAVMEMFKLIQSDQIKKETQNQLMFKNIVKQNSSDYFANGILPKARISSHFIDKYSELLD